MHHKIKTVNDFFDECINESIVDQRLIQIYKSINIFLHIHQLDDHYASTCINNQIIIESYDDEKIVITIDYLKDGSDESCFKFKCNDSEFNDLDKKSLSFDETMEKVYRYFIL